MIIFTKSQSQRKGLSRNSINHREVNLVITFLHKIHKIAACHLKFMRSKGMVLTFVHNVAQAKSSFVHIPFSSSMP